ncbi:hypothetical protein M8C21_031353 [Ambrosia artemisiifolia]|uniref:Uncharacterized protein n=1 Tax=Ambrosia artemisiifolia TaxID=4212 RepID=A0AAD5BZI4_AMBAR|nr:hypothetical protein M8C21_031353 [Ambrosia artemisiifolia]
MFIYIKIKGKPNFTTILFSFCLPFVFNDNVVIRFQSTDLTL